jgi:hypothetical protein
MDMRIRMGMARLVVAASMAVGGVLIGSVSPAAAATTARLGIEFVENGVYRVTVSGSTSNISARKVVMRLWGEDYSYDDLLVGPYEACVGDICGWSFSYSFLVSDSTLDEDWDGRDEIYAGVRVYNRSGVQLEWAETNRVYGYY